MLCIPLVVHPLGWALLGLGSYALYKVSQRQGEKTAALKKTAPITVHDEAQNIKGNK